VEIQQVAPILYFRHLQPRAAVRVEITMALRADLAVGQDFQELQVLELHFKVIMVALHQPMVL
jgi:hypothetical protein